MVDSTVERASLSVAYVIAGTVCGCCATIAALRGIGNRWRRPIYCGLAAHFRHDLMLLYTLMMMMMITYAFKHMRLAATH